MIFLFDSHDRGPQIFDLDSVLPFPCALSDYLSEALKPYYCDQNEPANLSRYMRIIPAQAYLNNFSSNRSHMWDASRGRYMSPPPEYPCLQSTSSSNNLHFFIDMNQVADRSYGMVMSFQDFTSCSKYGSEISFLYHRK